MCDLLLRSATGQVLACEVSVFTDSKLLSPHLGTCSVRWCITR